jgi:hypothetical protein
VTACRRPRLRGIVRAPSVAAPLRGGFYATDATLTACGADCGMDDPIETADEIKKAELRESVKQVLIHLLDDPQIQQKIVVLVQKQLLS